MWSWLVFSMRGEERRGETMCWWYGGLVVTVTVGCWFGAGRRDFEESLRV